MIDYDKKVEYLLLSSIKDIPVRIFVRWGAGKKTFCKKFSSPQSVFFT